VTSGLARHLHARGRAVRGAGLPRGARYVELAARRMALRRPGAADAVLRLAGAPRRSAPRLASLALRLIAPAGPADVAPRPLSLALALPR